MNLNFICKNPETPVPLPPKSSLYEAMPREEYNNVPALSYSLIKRWMDMESVPQKFKWWLTHRWEEEKSESLLLGLALDATILGGFDKHFAIVPMDSPKRPSAYLRAAKKPSADTKFAIEWWDKFLESNAGKFILAKGEMNIVEQMVNSLLHSKATDKGAIFKECKKTTAINLELFGGFPWKSEFDLWNPSTEHMCDLKLTRDAAAPSFGRDAVTYGYDIQAAVYLSMAQSLGKEKSMFDFVCVEKEEPYTVKVYRFNLQNDRHHRLFQSVCKRIEQSAKNLLALSEQGFEEDGLWEDLQLPDYALKQSENKELLLLP